MPPQTSNSPKGNPRDTTGQNSINQTPELLSSIEREIRKQLEVLFNEIRNNKYTNNKSSSQTDVETLRRH